ncbi:MAG TPA: HPF/RaiA family ribosome-associated protein [Methylomirabilota bacterium]|nr:HPF/RaiA family ribosome-associated protein [Methylomirabilota bacterium]
MSLVMEGIALDDPLRAHVEEKLGGVIRGRRPPTAVRVGFRDENGPKGGLDIRCALTVELPRQAPVHAEAVAADHRLAFDGALGALRRELKAGRERRRDAARRPKKYYVAHRALLPEGEAALPPARRRRRGP